MEPIIKPDERWKIFYGIETHQEFIDKFQLNFYLTSQAPDDIKGIFNVIQRLLIHSYFEYEFVDVAAEKAKLGLETALKIRYRELTGEVWPRKKNYEKLLDWFREKGHFEWNSKGLLDHVRTIRNLSAHAELHSFAGMLSYQHVVMVLLLINDTYEDIPKREQRISQAESWNVHLLDLLPKGCMLKIGHAEPELIYFMTVPFINNKRSPNLIHLCYMPIFPIPAEYKRVDAIQLYGCEKLTCHFIDSAPGYFRGNDENGREVFGLTAISDPDQQNKWNTWKADFDKYRATMIMFDPANSHDINAHITSLLTEFHRS